jgi:HAD superfamily hydrolase (TIGR01490 family)
MPVSVCLDTVDRKHRHLNIRDVRGLSCSIVGSQPGRRAAAFFDLDKTIIAKSSTLAMGRPFYAGGLINRRAVLRTAYAQLVFALGGADATAMDRMRSYAQQMCAGWEVDQVKAIVDEALHDLIDPLIYDEAASLIEWHHDQGHDVVIVSSSGEEIVTEIGRMVGADHAIGTRMSTVDGRYTGEIDFYAYGPAKADAVRELAVDAGYDLAECYAYSDSITDVPMLEAVGHPTAVNPDRALRKLATQRGWPVAEFKRPVRLRQRIPQLSAAQRTAAGVALATGVAVVAIGWLNQRRRRAS